MIVQCEQCRTKFKLDDSKVGENGVKVRCSKCRHIFLVKPEKASVVDEPDIDSLLTGLEGSPSFRNSDESGQVADDSGVAESVPDRDGIIEREPEPTGFAPFTVPAVEHKDKTEPDFSFPFSADDYATPPALTSADDLVSPDADSDSVRISGKETGGTPAPSPFDVTGFLDETDKIDGELSFKEGGVESRPVKATAPDDEHAAPNPPEPERESLPVPDTARAETATDLGRVPALDRAAEQAGFAQTDSTADRAPFQEGDSTTASSENVAASPSLPVPDFALSADEPPPLAIASRRRSSSLLPLIATVVSVVSIVVLAGVGYYLMDKGPAAINTLGLSSVAQWAGLSGADEGSIVLRGTKSEFVRNSEVGEVFVIRGEAVNDYKKPRASIQVKATILGAKGEQLSSRSVYCGNLLTRDQIVALPLAKLEAAMSNQFGDSLSNLGVQPGKAIPFVIVIPGVPKDATEFGLAVAGSTVANQ